MKKWLVAGIVFAGLAHAQTPNIAGVWKADLAQSQIPGPPAKDYVEVIETNGPKITERILSVGGHGEQRSALTFSTDGKPTIEAFQGVPVQITSTSDGPALLLTIQTSGRPDVAHRRYQLSADGKTLTLTLDAAMNGKTMHSMYVLQQQPQAAGEALNKPEALASEHFKNVKTSLKDLPASQFIDQMHFFAWALNKNCEFCHVQGHFDSDDKKEKRTARQMIAMVNTVTDKYLDGKPKVNCYTCHRFQEHPQLRPRFEGEPEEQHNHEEAKR